MYDAVITFVMILALGAVVSRIVADLADRFHRQVLPVKLLAPLARLPRRETLGSAGLSVASLNGVMVPPMCRRQLRTGLAVAIPAGYVGLIYELNSARDGGLSVRGVVDSGDHGELLLSAANETDEWYTVESGDFIAQIVVVPFLRLDAEVAFELQPGRAAPRHPEADPSAPPVANAWNAIIGKWPGDETNEQIQTALELS